MKRLDFRVPDSWKNYRPRILNLKKNKNWYGDICPHFYFTDYNDTVLINFYKQAYKKEKTKYSIIFLKNENKIKDEQFCASENMISTLKQIKQIWCIDNIITDPNEIVSLFDLDENFIRELSEIKKFIIDKFIQFVGIENNPKKAYETIYNIILNIDTDMVEEIKNINNLHEIWNRNYAGVTDYNLTRLFSIIMRE